MHIPRVRPDDPTQRPQRDVTARRHPSGGRLLLMLLLTLLLSACSVPGRGDDSAADGTPDASAEADAGAGAVPTRAPLMPVVTPTAVSTDAGAGSSPAAGQETTEIPSTYVVQENDSLYAIALRFGIDLDVLIAANGLSDPNDIQVGQELVIPTPQP